MSMQFFICTQEASTRIYPNKVMYSLIIISLKIFLCSCCSKHRSSYFVEYIIKYIRSFQPAIWWSSQSNIKRIGSPTKETEIEGGRSNTTQSSHNFKSKYVFFDIIHFYSSIFFWWRERFLDAKGLSVAAQQIVSDLRDRVQEVLFEVIKELNPTSTATARFGNLLLLIPTIMVRILASKTIIFFFFFQTIYFYCHEIK